MESKIKIVNLNKIFNTRHQKIYAVKDANIDVKEGEFVSFIGPSGCGKSTIIRMIDDIIKPTSGEIYIDNVNITKYKRIPMEINKKMGFIFQLPNLFPWLTVRENVKLPLKLYGMDNVEYNSYVDELLEMSGLTKYQHSYPSEISSGVMQRIGVIRAMVHKPDILLMDEPFGALDPMNRENLDMEILSIWEKLKTTVIFITHNVEEAVLLSDRVYVMGTNPGRILNEITLDLPRPRSLNMLTDIKFQQYCVELTKYIGHVELSKIK